MDTSGRTIRFFFTAGHPRYRSPDPSKMNKRFPAWRLSDEEALVALEGINDDLDYGIQRNQAQLRSLSGSAEELTAQIRIESEELIQMQ